MTGKILIVEDNVAEAINAQTELARVGFRDFMAVTNLSEALNVLPEYNCVLTDLFFPVGSTSAQPYIERFFPIYERFKDERFKKTNRDSPIARAIEQVTGVLGMTPDDYESKLAPLFNHPPAMRKAIKDALGGRGDLERYQKYLVTLEKVKNGTQLPLGIIVAEEAKKQGLTAVIVTSTNHHDDAFEPVRSIIPVSYRDNLIDGKKDWKGGIEIMKGGYIE